MPFPIIYSLFKSIQFQGGLPSNSPFSIQSPKTIFTEVSADALFFPIPSGAVGACTASFGTAFLILAVEAYNV